jgi:hypothetical protein
MEAGMRKQLAQSLVVLAVMALSVPVAADPAGRSLSLSLWRAAQVGKVEIGAGSYTVQIDGQRASLMQGKTRVAESEGRWETRETKYRRNGYLVDGEGRLRELRFEGDNQVFVLAEP